MVDSVSDAVLVFVGGPLDIWLCVLFTTHSFSHQRSHFHNCTSAWWRCLKACCCDDLHKVASGESYYLRLKGFVREILICLNVGAFHSSITILSSWHLRMKVKHTIKHYWCSVWPLHLQQSRSEGFKLCFFFFTSTEDLTSNKLIIKRSFSFEIFTRSHFHIHINLFFFFFFLF